MNDISQSNITNLHNLLDYNATKYISAEIQLKKKLPVWINVASSVKLKGILQKYLDIVEQHVEKLQKFIEDEKISSLALGDKIMQSFIEEAEERLKICSDLEIKNASLLASIQLINHFKIGKYGTAAAYAKALGMKKYGNLFHEIEINEKQIDDRLTQLAEYEINLKAVAPIVLPE